MSHKMSWWDSHHLAMFGAKLQSSLRGDWQTNGCSTNSTSLALDDWATSYVADHNNIMQHFEMKYDSITKRLSGFKYIKCYGKKGYGDSELECPCSLVFSKRLARVICLRLWKLLHPSTRSMTYLTACWEFTEPHYIYYHQ